MNFGIESGHLEVGRVQHPNGPEYITFKWAGGNVLLVTEELVREANGSPHWRGGLFDAYFYAGPYKLTVTGYNDDKRYFVCYRPNTLRNRIMPKVYPLYVWWVALRRWVVTKEFRVWLKEKIERFVLWLAFGV